MEYHRELTYPDTILKQAVSEWNILGIRPMYAQINERIEGKIRITDNNRRRLAVLVREGHLGLIGKRYYNPEFQVTNPNRENEEGINISWEELLKDAETNKLNYFILSLRAHNPNDLAVIAQMFKEKGLNKTILRRLELTVALLKLLLANHKSVPELDIADTNMHGTDVIGILWNLIGAWDE